MNMKVLDVVRARAVWTLVLAVVSIAASSVHASEGLDFGYAVDGPLSLRPTLVFNDGTDTYIQPADGVTTIVRGAIPDGPYLRVEGLPDTVSVSAGRVAMRVRHLTAGRRNAGYSRTQVVYGQPEEATSAAGRGTIAATAAVNGASGATKAGTANAGGQAKLVSVSAASGSTAKDAQALLDRPQERSMMALAFGAQAIRETSNGTIQIRFAVRPESLQVKSGDGKAVDLSWSEDGRTATFASLDQFTVAKGDTAIAVVRKPEFRFVFPRDNGAQLETVFEQNNATYFGFSKVPSGVTVFAEGTGGTGELKDRYYRFNGAADRLMVIADGKSVSVERVAEVRFSESKVVAK